MRHDLVRAVHACHATELEDGRWLAGLCEALRPIAPTGAVLALRVGTEGEALAYARGDPPAGLEELARGWLASAAPASAHEPHPAPAVEIMLRSARRTASAAARLAALRALGATDALGLFARAGGVGVAVVMPASTPIGLGARRRAVLSRIAEHLAVAVQHRAGARPRVPLPGEEALALWESVTAGGWTLARLERRPGRVRLVLLRSHRGGRDPAALSAREWQVLARLAGGGSNKEAAYALGVVPSTVAGHMRTALAKLGLGSRRELIGLLSGVTPPEPGSSGLGPEPREQLGASAAPGALEQA